jgi:pimeloyl-ACP methyl ester carboxylesterase/heat shock protein HslJ
MKKLLLLFYMLMLAACTAMPTVEPGIPVTGDGTPTSQIEGNPEIGQVQANGITLAYESFGSPEEETILLIGGVGQQLTGWPLELVTGLVERGYRVVRFDNRDIGLSTKLTDAGIPDAEAVGKALQEGTIPPIPYTIRDMAKDTVGLLDALGIQQAHLVGASMGGAIAQWVAIDDPERVLSLTTLAADSGNPQLPVIADPEAFANVPPQPTTPDRETFINWQVKTFQVLAGSTYPADEGTLREWAERDFARGFDPAGLVRQQNAILVDNYAPSAERWNKLPEIKVPTVIVQGTEDPLVPMVSAEDLAARIPNAELRVIPGLGHFIPLELVPEITEAIMAAVQGTIQPPTATMNGLSGSSWQLVSFGPVGATNPVIGNVRITLEFGADGQAGGNGGCNSYGGSYTVHDNSLQFGEITSTLIACADQAVTEQEQQYLEALRTAGRFTIEGDTLKIAYQNDGGELNFTRSSGATSEPPAATMTTIPVTALPSPVDPPERIEFESGTTAQRSGLLPSGLSVKQYVLAGSAGQTMTVDVFSDDVPLSMTITVPSGMQRIPEMSPADGGGYRVGHEFTLPESGDYLVTLTKADHTPSTNYTADFTIR